MTTEQNKAIVRKFIAASADDDQPALMELLSPDFAAHLAEGPAQRDVFLLHNSVFAKAFSDRQFTINELVAEGDKVMVRATWRGTHTSSFRGLSPTGKRIAISAFIADRIQDGKIVEHWSLFDQLSMMQQLGLIP